MERLIAALLLFAAAAGAPAANVYKCKDDKGNIVYTDKKCDPDAKPQRIWDSHLGDVAYPAMFSGATPDEARGGAGQNESQHAIRERCAAKWPGDYKMTEYCIGEQVKAAAAMQPVIERAGRDEALQAIIGRCAMKWRDGNTFDYSMVKYCYEEQQGARERLER